MLTSERTEPLDQSLRGWNPEHRFSGEWNPQLQMILMAAGKHHPHWRVFHAGRVHLWELRDACVVPSMHPTGASLCLWDACVVAALCAWVGCLRARYLLLNTLRPLNVAIADQSVTGRSGHHQVKHTGDTRVVPKLGRVHLFGKRCACRRGHVLQWAR